MLILGVDQLLVEILTKIVVGGGETIGYRIMAHVVIILGYSEPESNGVNTSIACMILGNSRLKFIKALEDPTKYCNRSPISDHFIIRDKKKHKNSKLTVQIEPMYVNIFTPDGRYYMLYLRSIED